jgi:hypothetical protein
MGEIHVVYMDSCRNTGLMGFHIRFTGPCWRTMRRLTLGRGKACRAGWLKVCVDSRMEGV